MSYANRMAQAVAAAIVVGSFALFGWYGFGVVVGLALVAHVAYYLKHGRGMPLD